MGKQEIKCPHCAQWTKWNGALYDRCWQCKGLIEEEKINKIQAYEKKKQIAEELERARIAKQNPFFRKVVTYSSMIFIGFILIIIAIVVLVAG